MKFYSSIAAALAFFALLLFGYEYEKKRFIDMGKSQVQQAWDKQAQEAESAEKQAVIDRLEQNRLLAIVHAKDLDKQREDAKNEINQIRTDSANVGRLRANKNLCERVAASPSAEGGKGSDTATTGTWLLSEKYSNDIKQLMLEADTHIANCRAIQKFILSNGLVSE